MVMFMFNLIYVVLGIYLIKIISIRMVIEYKKIGGKERRELFSFRKSIIGKIKNVFSEGNNIFIYRESKNNNKEVNDIHIEEEWNLKRQDALEKAKYNCEECGNIANLEVYENNFNSSSNELIVLCKKCYEKNIDGVNLHYE